jgi:hypothetical protein
MLGRVLQQSCLCLPFAFDQRLDPQESDYELCISARGASARGASRGATWNGDGRFLIISDHVDSLIFHSFFATFLPLIYRKFFHFHSAQGLTTQEVTLAPLHSAPAEGSVSGNVQQYP